MVDDLKAAKPGDVVLLHGCCHNPSGADLTLEQWSVIADMAIAQGFTVLVDLAYQGMGQGLAEDVAGLRLLATRLGELIVAASCSKNLGLYRERTGLPCFMVKIRKQQRRLRAMVWCGSSCLLYATCARRLARRTRIKHARTARVVGSGAQSNLPPHDSLRTQLSDKLSAKTDRDFSFIAKENGMFSFLGLSVEQAQGLRKERGLYMLDSSRINVAALNDRNMDIVVDAVASVL